ncbi:MAG TPA: CHRD domain-containing protein [Gemmatimonadaceae bacterium]
MRTPLLTLAAAVVVAAACGGSSTAPAAKIVNLGTTLSPANEPGVVGNPTSSGTFSATLDTSTNIFTWTGTFTGMTSTVILGHIHGPFIPGGTATTAGVILNFDPAATPGATFVGLNSATSGSVSGSILLTSATQFTSTVNGDSLRKLLLAGQTYANIHTSTNKGGEIRGQITIK